MYDIVRENFFIEPSTPESVFESPEKSLDLNENQNKSKIIDMNIPSTSILKDD